MSNDRRNLPFRRAMTLVELLSAMIVTALIVGALAAMGTAVYDGAEFSRVENTTTQHARVVLGRIERTVRGAHATEGAPGFSVLADQVSTWTFPDTLVVWHPRVTPTTPDAKPVDPEGLPRFNELVVYCPNPNQPNELWELTADDGDTRTVNVATLAADVTALKADSGSQKVVLTDRMRTASMSGTPADLRGCVRFEAQYTPSLAEWTALENGTLPWEQLSWVQGVYGSQTGLRQAWVRIELQLDPARAEQVVNPQVYQPQTFFGSAALYYQMRKPA